MKRTLNRETARASEIAETGDEREGLGAHERRATNRENPEQPPPFGCVS